MVSIQHLHIWYQSYMYSYPTHYNIRIVIILYLCGINPIHTYMVSILYVLIHQPISGVREVVVTYYILHHLSHGECVRTHQAQGL